MTANLAKGCAPLSIIDDCGRFASGLEALRGTKSRPVRQTLETIFRTDGMPEAMLLDHGTRPGSGDTRDAPFATDWRTATRKFFPIN